MTDDPQPPSDDPQPPSEGPRPPSEGSRPPKPKPAVPRPASVRAGMPGETEPPEISVESREVTIRDDVWTVQVEGRARVRTGGTGTPLLELTFRSEGGELREALAVGRSLAVLTEDQLAEALRTARPPDPARSEQGFFEGTEQVGGRGRR